MRRRAPILMPSIFAGSWVDWNRHDGSHGFVRYFCSAMILDVTDACYGIMHHETKIGVPQFIELGLLGDLTFVVPQPPIPSDDALFDKEVPFWFSSETTKRGKK